MSEIGACPRRFRRTGLGMDKKMRMRRGEAVTIEEESGQVSSYVCQAVGAS